MIGENRVSFEISSKEVEDEIIELRQELEKDIEECEKLYPLANEKTLAIVMDG